MEEGESGRFQEQVLVLKANYIRYEVRVRPVFRVACGKLPSSSRFRSTRELSWQAAAGFLEASAMGPDAFREEMCAEEGLKILRNARGMECLEGVKKWRKEGMQLARVNGVPQLRLESRDSYPGSLGAAADNCMGQPAGNSRPPSP